MGKTIVVIPARMASERLPGKPLLEAGGLSLLRWTYRRARSTKADHVIVATADREIARHCDDNGMLWRPTREDHWCGTSRCAEVLEQIKRSGKAAVDVGVNWQVDEPLVDPADVDRLIESVRGRDKLEVGTLVWGPIANSQNESVVPLFRSKHSTKAAVLQNGRAVWFSKAPMSGCCLHVGVYTFPADTLQRLGQFGPTPLSRAESLEQLTWLEHGYKMQTLKVDRWPGSVNTEEDWEEFKRKVEGGEDAQD